MRITLPISTLALLAGSHAFSPILPQASTRMMAAPTTKSVRFMPELNMAAIENSEHGNELVEENLKNPTPVLMSFMKDLMGTNDSKKNMKIATTLMAFALAMLPLNADAAMSGGRMGGSFSAPRQSISRPARSSSSFNRGYSSGYSSGYYTRPSTTIITPGVGFGYNPFFSPVTPYYGGAGVISYNRGPGLFEILFFGGALFAVANILSNAGSAVADGTSSFGIDSTASSLGGGTSVVQMSVALEVPNRDDPNSILSALDRLAATARTDSRVGIQNLTSQVALELLRRRSSITSATSSYVHFRDPNKASREFQSRSVKERSKFEAEMVSKYGGVDYSLQGSAKKASDGDKATMAVVTIILAIDGDSTKLPKINSVSDAEAALRKIASDSKVDDCLQSAEILWTPEDRTETLTRGDVIADYPELRAI